MNDDLPELPEINVTPLVDVMLVLVVLLLLMAPMIGHSLPVDIPKVASSGVTLAALPKIEILRDGQYRVDGVLSSPQTAVNYAVVKGGAVLFADKNLPYEKLAKTMGLFAAANVPISLAVSPSAAP
jgi:biopolymer transport protein ExbD